MQTSGWVCNVYQTWCWKSGSEWLLRDGFGVNPKNIRIAGRSDDHNKEREREGGREREEVTGVTGKEQTRKTPGVFLGRLTHH